MSNKLNYLDKNGLKKVLRLIKNASHFVTPEDIRNQNILSDYEAVILPLTAQYDGELVINCRPTNEGINIKINGVDIAAWAVYISGVSNSVTLTLKKGDIVEVTKGTYKDARARWYKLRDYTGR